MKYVGRITDRVKLLIDVLFKDGGNIAYDMTLGNGNDAVFLSRKFKKVIALDIQKEAIEKFSAPQNVMCIHKDHSEIDDLIKESSEEKADLILYNLGYLPGGDKNIKTHGNTTVKSIKKAFNLLNDKGFILISSYTGHDEGKEKDIVEDFLKTLDDKEYSVLKHEYLNRVNYPPVLYVIEKRG